MNITGALLPGLAQAAAPLSSASPTSAGGSEAMPFGDLLKNAVAGVDGLQSTADTSISSLLQGAANSDVGSTMVTVEKADVAFQLMMQVRNKVVSAYQDIARMQF